MGRANAYASAPTTTTPARKTASVAMPRRMCVRAWSTSTAGVSTIAKNAATTTSPMTVASVVTRNHTTRAVPTTATPMPQKAAKRRTGTGSRVASTGAGSVGGVIVPSCPMMSLPNRTSRPPT